MSDTPTIPPVGKVIGVDWGAARIGLAVSDVTQTLATPHSTVHTKDKGRQIKDVVALAESLEAVGFVVGLPLQLDGEVGDSARSSTKYADKLGQVSGLPVDRTDERFSSAEAEERLIASGSRKRKRGESMQQWKGRLDAAAAAVLLQEWLDGRG